jgi:anti-anti-sigma regulatory factor
VPASAEAIFSLNKPVTAEALSALRASAAAAAGAGSSRVVDDVGVLDSQLISGLISLLRDVREQGGDVTLLAQHKSILDTLRITALDKVFTVEPPRATAPAELPATRIRASRPRLAALAIVLTALACLPGQSI